MPEGTELKDYPDPRLRGLNSLLASPDSIASLDETGYKKPEVIKPKEWQELYEVLGKLRPLLAKSLELDGEKEDEVYTVEMGADNGVLFAFQNETDPDQTTTVYLSSHGKELSDWGPGLRIPPDRVMCHQVKIVSRKKVAPHIYTASELRFRVSPDFRLIEGDPSHKKELEARGMFSDNKTFLLDSNTRYHIAYIEVDDPVEEVKTLAPLVADAKDLWRLATDAGRGEIFWRLLTGRLEDADLEKVESAFVDFGGNTVVDIEEVMRIGREIAGDLIAQAKATMRAVPITFDYLRDLKQNLAESKPVEVTRETLFPKTFDQLGIGKRRYLEKRAWKKLGRWEQERPDIK